MVYGSHDDYDGKKGPGAYRTFRDLDLVVEQSVRELRNRLHEFSSIVVTGTSGMVAGAPVALRLDVPLVVVKKKSPDDTCYTAPEGDVIGEADLGPKPLFYDDIISSGKTIKRCIEAVGMFAAAYQYEYNSFTYRQDFRSYWMPEGYHQPDLSPPDVAAEIVDAAFGPIPKPDLWLDGINVSDYWTVQPGPESVLFKGGCNSAV